MKRQKPGAKPDTATNIHPQVATWLEALSSQVQFPKKLWILLFFCFSGWLNQGPESTNNGSIITYVTYVYESYLSIYLYIYICIHFIHFHTTILCLADYISRANPSKQSKRHFPTTYRQDALRQAVADVADVEAQLENPETQLDFKHLPYGIYRDL